MIRRIQSLRHTMKKALPALAVLLLLAPVANGQSAATLLNFPGAQSAGVAVDYRNNTFYTLWLGSDPVVAYNPYLNAFSRTVELPNSTFVSPASAVVARGGIVVADKGLAQLQWVDPTCGAISNLCPVSFSAPSAVTADRAGNLYVGDATGVYKLDLTNGVTALGSGYVRVAGLAVDDAGQIWVADSSGEVIRLIQVNGTNVTVSIVAGKLKTPGPADALTTRATNARFNYPMGLTWVGGATGLLVADYGNNALRNVTFDASCNCYNVGTVATGFNGPVSVAIDNEGSVIVADSKSGSIKSIARNVEPVPFIMPPSGNYSNAVTATFSTALLPSFSPTFRYTLDNTLPTRLSPSGTSVTFDGMLRNDPARYLRLRCFAPDLATSVEASNLYTFFVDLPVCNPKGATNNNAVWVTLTNATVGATQYWTIDGTEPSATNGTLYSGPFLLGANGTLKVKGYKTGYTNSATLSQVFALSVSAPVISPAASTNLNNLQVTISCATTDAAIRYTTDGSDPTSTSTLYTGTITLDHSLTLKAQAFRDGFVDSPVVSSSYGFVVADPVISPNGAASDSPVAVTVTDATAGAVIYWTIDGSEPGPGANQCLNGVPFTLGTNGTLNVKAFKSGYASSSTVQAAFNLTVATPIVTAGGTFENSVHVDATCSTAGSELHYTLDGSTPTLASPIWTPTTFITNTTLTVVAFKNGFASSLPQVVSYQIQVDTPVLTPPGGYYPDGVMVSLAVSRPNAVIYYTINGGIPTTNDTRYTGPFKLDQVLYDSVDMTAVRARAFAPNTIPSGVASGQSYQTNMIGVDRDMVGGIGSKMVIPVTVTLAGTQEVRSLLFRLEVVPATPTTPALVDYMDGLSVLTNDFRPIVLGTTDGKATIFYPEPYQVGNTSGVKYASIATNLQLRGYAVAANFMVPIPATAHLGDKYTVQVVGASATSDAQQHSIPIFSAPPRTLTISNAAYLVGDSAPGGWYNAGDFGDNILDSADVNNAMDASLGIRTPYEFTDAFNAMDVFPVDSDGVAGGDGELTFYDWHILWARAVGLDTNNWVRYWAEGGILTNRPVFTAKSARASSLRTAAAPVTLGAGSVTTPPPGLVWFRNARIESQTITNAQPGNEYNLPVYLVVKPGSSVAGLQFRAAMIPMSGAPGLDEALTFTPVAGIPQPISRPALLDVVCVWPIIPTPSFSPALQGTNLLGYIHWKAPEQAAAGQSYRLTFAHCSGSPDLQTQYFFESRPADAWIRSTATAPSTVISDEWKIKFFQTIDNVQAAPDADPDHDGVPNWQEYLAGTNPTNAESRLKFVSSTMNNHAAGVGLKWLTAPGVNYTIERASTLVGGSWTTVTNVSGDGAFREITDANGGGQARFYRIRAAAQ